MIAPKELEKILKETNERPLSFPTTKLHQDLEVDENGNIILIYKDSESDSNNMSTSTLETLLTMVKDTKRLLLSNQEFPFSLACLEIQVKSLNSKIDSLIPQLIASGGVKTTDKGEALILFPDTMPNVAYNITTRKLHKYGVMPEQQKIIDSWKCKS
jgi:hypothetical protein